MKICKYLKSIHFFCPIKELETLQKKSIKNHENVIFLLKDDLPPSELCPKYCKWLTLPLCNPKKYVMILRTHFIFICIQNLLVHKTSTNKVEAEKNVKKNTTVQFFYEIVVQFVNSINRKVFPCILSNAQLIIWARKEICGARISEYSSGWNDCPLYANYIPFFTIDAFSYTNLCYSLFFRTVAIHSRLHQIIQSNLVTVDN